jgi:hypothetical protein
LRFWAFVITISPSSAITRVALKNVDRAVGLPGSPVSLHSCAALAPAAFADLTASDALELLSKAPDPARAARLSRTQISAALKRARRRDVDTKAEAIVTALRSEQLTQPPAVAAAYAATVQSLSTIIATFNGQIAALENRWQPVLGEPETPRST